MRGKLEGEEIEYIDYNFGDPDVVVSLLARLVASTSEYVRELVDNSVDDLWDPRRDQFRRGEYTITVTIDRFRNRIIVSDDCNGITKERLREIPSTIGGSAEGKRQLALSLTGGTSRKEQIARLRGINQVGVHAWEVVGRSCLITSRSVLSPERTYSLLMAFGPNGRKVRPQIAPENKNRNKTGTDVEISDIDPSQMTKINVTKLEGFLAQEYRKELASQLPKIRIELVEIDRSRKTKPVRYVSPVVVRVNNFSLNGKQEKCLVWTSYGSHHQEWITWVGGILPNRRDGRCRVWWGHRRIYNDVTEIEGFDCPPWNTGRLDIDFQANFCETDAAKKVLISDVNGNFDAFKKGLRELQAPLLDLINEADAARPVQIDNLAKKLRNMVVDSFMESGYSVDGFPVRKRVQVGGADEVNVGLGKRGGSKKKFGKEGADSFGLGLGRDDKPVDPTKPKKTASSRPKFDTYPLAMPDNPVRAEVRTNEEGRLVAVILNSAHPDYSRFVEPQPNGGASRRYQIDQLVSALYTFFYGDVKDTKELIDEINSLRYRTYQRDVVVSKE